MRKADIEKLIVAFERRIARHEEDEDPSDRDEEIVEAVKTALEALEDLLAVLGG